MGLLSITFVLSGPITFLLPVESVIKQLKASRQWGDIRNHGEQLDFSFFFLVQTETFSTFSLLAPHLLSSFFSERTNGIVVQTTQRTNVASNVIFFFFFKPTAGFSATSCIGSFSYNLMQIFAAGSINVCSVTMNPAVIEVFPSWSGCFTITNCSVRIDSIFCFYWYIIVSSQPSKNSLTIFLMARQFYCHVHCSFFLS